MAAMNRKFQRSPRCSIWSHQIARHLIEVAEVVPVSLVPFRPACHQSILRLPAGIVRREC
jgi:hypothetical protein